MTRGRRLALVPIVAGAGLALSFVPFVWPATGDPAQADAVVVLSGDHGERLSLALDLLERGVTTTLVFAGALDSARAIELCHGDQSFEVICLTPRPDNTREEARAAGRLAEARGWRRVVVATSNAHVLRAGLLFERCVEGDVIMIGGDPPYSRRMALRNLVREWLGVARALSVARAC